MPHIAPRLLRRSSLSLGLLASPYVSGCLATDPPGEQVGIFDVSERLEENTCGDTAVVAGDNRFAVELRKDRDIAYWQYLGGQPLVGTFTDDDSFELQVRTDIPLYAGTSGAEDALSEPLDFGFIDPDVAERGEASPGCTLAQTEVLRGNVDPIYVFPDAGVADAADAADAGERDADAPAMTGEHVQTLTPTADSDCRQALTSQGGTFRDLPCTITYSLTATRR